MTTVTVDIINEKAMKLLEDMELLQLIRVRTTSIDPSVNKTWIAKYKGAMTQQTLHEVDTQLKELRDGWE
ncbi:hypothetical protein LX99_04141 [Mucilaginibacter oryzae]|uniref:Uncharacterized protein n=1 Tax=Mucilaginibacter oryzae TaxID=468058 RepID=A0A316H2C9_9SPHI|nr:hypothetical protein [Mucilaginibacter oryzae]PWK73756.1 hypothetical protein LX99_04141 [Mucilaginibacter oryzae]